MSLHLQNIDHVVGGQTHISGVNLELEPGSFNVLLGRTLAGKTTLMRLMAGLEQPTRGRLPIRLGRRLPHLRRQDRRQRHVLGTELLRREQLARGDRPHEHGADLDQGEHDEDPHDRAEGAPCRRGTRTLGGQDRCLQQQRDDGEAEGEERQHAHRDEGGPDPARGDRGRALQRLRRSDVERLGAAAAARLVER